MTTTAGPTIQLRRKRRRWLILAAALLAVAAFAAATLVEARSLSTRTIAFSSPDLPAAFDGLRVAFVSDVHHVPTSHANGCGTQSHASTRCIPM